MKLKRFAHIFYIKWVKGECRHFCFKCQYKNECYDNLEY